MARFKFAVFFERPPHILLPISFTVCMEKDYPALKKEKGLALLGFVEGNSYEDAITKVTTVVKEGLLLLESGK